MANQIDQKIMDKLHKLLALATSDNEHEAKLAMDKAKEIMREHKVSTIDVAIDGSGAYVSQKEVEGLTKTSQTWEANLGSSIARIFDGRAIRTRGSYSGWKLTFVAGRTDLEIIVDLYERTRKTIRDMSAKYVNMHKDDWNAAPVKTMHNSYRHGMVGTVVNRLKAMRQATATDDTAKNSSGVTGRELMIVKGRAVSQRVENLFPHLRTTTSRRSSVDGTAYRQGQADGHNVSLHRSVHGGGSGPIGIGR